MKHSHFIWSIWILVMHLGIAELAMAQDALANLPDPTRPSAAADAGRRHANPENQISHLRLESTIISGHRRLAIINGKVLAIGDRIHGARIKDITAYKVVLELKGRLVSLTLVEDNFTRRRDMKEAAR